MKKSSLKYRCPICGHQWRGPRQKRDCMDGHARRVLQADEIVQRNRKRDALNPMVTCLDCGNEQADMGVGVGCEECGGPVKPKSDGRGKA